MAPVAWEEMLINPILEAKGEVGGPRHGTTAVDTLG